MNALVFIIARSLKNSLKEILRKPAKLAVWAFVIAAIVGTFLLSVFIRSTPEHGTIDLIWLKGIVFALFTLFAILGVYKGLSNGDAIFSMSDVNFLFVSPVDSRHILLYGIVQMAKTSVMAGFFILFQGNSICANFNVSYSAVLMIFLGFILTVSLMQIVSLILYSMTNGRPKRKRLVRIITALLFVPLIAVFAVNCLQRGELAAAVQATLGSSALSFIPAAGWAAAGTLSFMMGNIGIGISFYALILLSAAALIFFILRSNPDYYEDVLVAAESAFEKKRAIAEGNANLEALSDKKTKVAATGIGGFGASALFFKHLRESFRANRLGLWSWPSLLYVIGAAGFAIAFREAGIVMILSIFLGGQIFLVGMERGIKELQSHYIYMLPQSAFAKILWSNAETVLKTLGESIALFAVAGLIMRSGIAEILLCIFVYTLFKLLLVGINYISLRFTGMDISAGLTLMIYMLLVIIAMLPGLIAAVAVGSVLSLAWGLGALAAWELIIACLSFAAAKGILHNCDMLMIKNVK